MPPSNQLIAATASKTTTRPPSAYIQAPRAIARLSACSLVEAAHRAEALLGRRACLAEPEATAIVRAVVVLIACRDFDLDVLFDFDRVVIDLEQQQP